VRKTSYPDIIIGAIERRRIIELRYKDVKRRVRPHILGYVGEGALALSAWQIAGTGSGWRLFHVDDIVDLTERRASAALSADIIPTIPPFHASSSGCEIPVLGTKSASTRCV
jgi:hypothetical protein